MSLHDSTELRQVFAEGEDKRVLKAVSIAYKKGYCKPILLGKSSLIKKKAKELGIELEGMEIISSKKPLQIQLDWQKLVTRS